MLIPLIMKERIKKAFGIPGISLILLFAVVMISRIPFVDHGYGMDPDSYRLVDSGRALAETGEYRCRRSPCHPVIVLTHSMLPPSSSLVFNAITAFLSAIAMLAYGMSLRILGIKNSFLAAMALAFTPIIYIHSTNSMDYIWAFSFSLIGVFGVLSSRLLFAGIAMGMAAGCRLEYLSLLLPLSLYLLVIENGRRRWLSPIMLSVFSGITAIIVFSPVWLDLGIVPIFSIFRVAIDVPTYDFINKISFKLFGGLGVFVVAALSIAVLSMPFVSATTRKIWFGMTRQKKGWVLLSAAAITIFFLGFSRAPYQAPYLIGCIPFLYGLFAVFLDVTLLGRRILFIGLLLMVVSPFVLTMELTDKINTHRNQLSLTAAPEVYADFELKGPMISVHQRRQEKRRHVDNTMKKIVAVSNRNTEEVLIVAGSMHFRLLDEWDPAIGDHVHSTELIRSMKHLGHYKKTIKKLYFLRGVAKYNKRAFGIRLRAHGAALLK